MQQEPRTRDVESLRAYIAGLEKRPLLCGTAPQASLAEGAGPADILELTAELPGLVQEVFAGELRNGSAALGFALGLARGLLSPSRTAILYLQLAAETQEIGLPYALGFQRFGLGADKLVLGRVESLADLLWALEESLACSAVAAVIADITGSGQDAIDFTASRRLSLRAAASGTTALLLRYGTGREASAAKLRWGLKPAVSGEVPFDPLAPGSPRFTVTVEKCRLGARAQRLEGQSFVLDWGEHGFAVVERGSRDRKPGRQTLSRPQPAALGHRLSQAS